MTYDSKKHSTPGMPSIKELVADILDVPVQEIDPGVELVDYGLDSLAAAEIVAALGHDLDCEVPDALLQEYQTIEALETFVRCRQSKPATCEILQSKAPVSPLSQMWEDSLLPPECIPAEGKVADIFSMVLLTGATGFLGAFLLRSLLYSTSARVFCLVRARENESPEKKIRSNLEHYGLWEETFAERIIGVRGDLAQPNLGLSPETWQSLTEETDAVYHAAASVNWVFPYKSLRAANVSGTRELIRLACQSRPKPIHYLSSTSVCYSSNGPEQVEENVQMFPYIEGIPLGYAQSKCVSEELLRHAKSRGLPVTVYRPSLICGDSRSGVSNLDDIVARLIRACVEMQVAPDMDWVLDSCPVDFVAETLVRHSLNREPGLDILHLVNTGPRHWRELILWMNHYGYPVRLIPFEQWANLLERDAQTPEHPLYALKPFFRTRVDGRGRMTIPEFYQEKNRNRVEHVRTNGMLAQLSLACPPLNGVLLSEYFKSFVRAGFLSNPRSGVESERMHVAVSLEEKLAGVLRSYYHNEDLEVEEVQSLSPPSGNSILAELAAVGGNLESGLCTRRVHMRHIEMEAPESVDVFIKTKWKDERMIQLAETTARVCGDRLGDLFTRFRDRLGFTGCHEKEVALYEKTDERLRRYTPEFFGTWHDPETETWSLALEQLNGMRQMNAVETVRGWTPETIHAVIQGLAEIHSVGWCREAELSCQPWMGPVLVTRDMVEMQELLDETAKHASSYIKQWAGEAVCAVHQHLVETVGDWWPGMEVGPRTLIHNDFSPRNLALRPIEGGSRLCAYDWELATVGVPQHDLAEFLCFVLTPETDRDSVECYLHLHRCELERYVGETLDGDLWLRGFRAALNDLLVNRFSMMLVAHRFQRQPYLERVINNWYRLYRMFL